MNQLTHMEKYLRNRSAKNPYLKDLLKEVHQSAEVLSRREMVMQQQLGAALDELTRMVEQGQYTDLQNNILGQLKKYERAPGPRT